jgi:hypothetical protein
MAVQLRDCRLRFFNACIQGDGALILTGAVLSSRFLAMKQRVAPRKTLSLASHLRCPPPRPHQQEPPVLQKLRGFAFNRMPKELQRPPKTE